MLNKKTLSIVSLIAAMIMVAALLWPAAPAFSDFEAGDPRKTVFIDYFQPLVEKANADVLEDRAKLLAIYRHRDDLNFFERRYLARLAEDYGITDFDTADDSHWQRLLGRVDSVPVSLAIAQAAKESGWGTSRFARQGNNYFGQWCFEAGCGMVPKNRARGKDHEVADFASPADAVRAYIDNLNSHDAYETLRAIRAKFTSRGDTPTGTALAEGLSRYSQRGQAYVNEIQAMIRVNSLERFDKPAASG